MKTERRGVSGFSITEVLVCLTLLSLIVLFSVQYLSQGRLLWTKVNASQDAGLTLRKGCAAIRAPLLDASGKEIGVTENGSGPNRMGQAFWFLSAVDPATGVFARADNGRPFWQKNILFYLTVPEDHDERYKLSCQSFARVCPHKILVRKVIDGGLPTGPNSPEEDEETLLTELEIAQHLLRPAGLDLSAQESLSGVVEARYITGHLLDLTVNLDQTNGKIREVDVLLEAGLIKATKNRLVLGRDEFTSPTFVLARTVGIIPHNF